MAYTNVAIVYGVTKWPQPEEDRPLYSLFNYDKKISFVKINETDIKKLAAEVKRNVFRNFRGRGGKIGLDEVVLKVEEELKKSALVHGGVRESANRQPRYAVTIYNASLPEVAFRGKHLNRREFFVREPKGYGLAENKFPMDFMNEDYNYNLAYLAENHSMCCPDPTIAEHCMKMRKKERYFKVLVTPVWSTDKQFFSFNKRAA
jgi:hypothetical protein